MQQFKIAFRLFLFFNTLMLSLFSFSAWGQELMPGMRLISASTEGSGAVTREKIECQAISSGGLTVDVKANFDKPPHLVRRLENVFLRSTHQIRLQNNTDRPKLYRIRYRQISPDTGESILTVHNYEVDPKKGGECNYAMSRSTIYYTPGYYRENAETFIFDLGGIVLAQVIEYRILKVSPS